jgi:protein O-mannosyl-transferase
MTRTGALAGAALFALLLATYANHFGNGFHFDDDHAIVSNPYVRSLRFVPRFFRDATTFSVLPLNQNYRPVLQTTFAIDYAIAGYRAVVFQVDTFVWFLLLAAATAALTRALTGASAAALVAAALLGLHPATADTVNYIVQRGEILAALGVVGGLWLFMARPQWRPRGIYLAPVVVGLLAKPTAAAFPLLLALYLLTYERRLVTRDLAASLIVTLVVSIWVASRTPASTALLSAQPVRYVLTQPFVALRYAAAFIAPVDLSVDYDWPLVSGAADPTLYVGIAFVVALGALAWRLSRSPAQRPIAFGLAWFLAAQLPTAAVPLTEVGNNWRMLLPFVGLAIACACAMLQPFRAASSVVQPCRAASSVVHPVRAATSASLTGCAAALVALVIAAEAMGARARNEVWRTDETLWRDATSKSPGNARAWMNYAVALMARGDYGGAVEACERALPLAPDYALLHVNLGVAYGAVGRRVEAEHEFATARRLAPSDWRTHLYYAQWLSREGRAAEAEAEAAQARALNPVAMSNQ